MNILFVWTSQFKSGGGVGRVTTTLGEEFVKRGHNVYYLSYSTGKEYIDNGIKQFFCPEEGSPTDETIVSYVKKIISQNDINIIINQTGISNPDILKSINTAIAELGNQAVIKVFTVHHNCVKCLYKHFELVIKDNHKNHWLYPVISNKYMLKYLKRRHKKKYRNIINYLIENSDYLVLLSEKFIPDLDTYLTEIPENKVVGIPNPAPFEVKDVEHKKENRLLYVGRINFQQKRADLLVELWKRIESQYPLWEFDVVGDGDALDDLKQMVRLENLDRIHLHGYQDPVPHLERAKFFVMTSAFEGFGMVLVEAQAYGVVPFAFNCFSSLSDILEDKVNGIVTEPFDIATYAERLEELMNNENRRKEMAECGRTSVGKFHPSKIARQWENLFAD